MKRSLQVELYSALATRGYAYLPAFSSDPGALPFLALARTFGLLYRSGGLDTDPDSPHIETHPAADASYLNPFDRPEGLGWHNDFSAHPERPAISFAFLAQADPCGPAHGAWRVASCDLVLDHLLATAEGASIVRFLRDADLPFSFSGEGPPTFLRVLERRPLGRLGMRFYGRTMRDGARLAYGSVPKDIERAISAVEAAADAVGRVLEARPGALLITDNWHALHDRLPQSVDVGLPLRRSLLCFVDHLHENQGAVPVVNPTH